MQNNHPPHTLTPKSATPIPLSVRNNIPKISIKPASSTDFFRKRIPARGFPAPSTSSQQFMTPQPESTLQYNTSQLLAQADYLVHTAINHAIMGDPTVRIRIGSWEIRKVHEETEYSPQQITNFAEQDSPQLPFTPPFSTRGAFQPVIPTRPSSLSIQLPTQNQIFVTPAPPSSTSASSTSTFPPMFVPIRPESSQLTTTSTRPINSSSSSFPTPSQQQIQRPAAKKSTASDNRKKATPASESEMNSNRGVKRVHSNALSSSNESRDLEPKPKHMRTSTGSVHTEVMSQESAPQELSARRQSLPSKLNPSSRLQKPTRTSLPSNVPRVPKPLTSSTPVSAPTSKALPNSPKAQNLMKNCRAKVVTEQITPIPFDESTKDTFWGVAADFH